MTLGPLMLDVAGPELTAEDRARLAHPLVGAVILFARNYTDVAQLRALVSEIRQLRSPALLIAVDQEGGRVQRFREGFQTLPPPRWFGHQFDVDPAAARALAEIAGWMMAAELLEVGIDFSFAPVVDLDYGVSEVIGTRAFHADPEVVTALAFAFIQGMRRAGMIAVVKHFPGHGFVVADSHKQLPVDGRTLAELEADLVPYRRLLARGVQGVLAAHIRYSQVDGEVSSLSPYWLQTVLRDELRFAGTIFSDDLGMHALAAVGDMPERVRRTLAAGADMALVCNDPAAADRVLAALSAEGGHFRPDPVGHARRIALRGQPAADARRGSATWQEAVAQLAVAFDQPDFRLSG
jgi:beta-N-acetylhexosaminidase